jgi:hypothetical protein
MKLTYRALIVFIVILALASILGAFIILNSGNSESNTEKDSDESVIRLSEAVETDYIVYYTTLVYVEENDESHIPGAFPKDDWALNTQTTCFGTMTRNCYWVPINSGIVEKDKLKRLELALEKNSSVESVDVSEENGKFLIRQNYLRCWRSSASRRASRCGSRPAISTRRQRTSTKRWR